MECTVTLQPSAVSFSTTAADTVLSAALAQNIVLSHSCKSGDCHTCLATLLSGKVQLADQRIITSGEFLTCTATCLEDVQIAADYLPELASQVRKQIPAKLQAIEYPSDNIAIITLRMPPTAKLEYLPGQYIDLIWQGIRRSYSIANGLGSNYVTSEAGSDAKAQPNRIELHLKNVPNGAMSQLLFNQPPLQSLMRIDGPQGTFFVRDNQRPLLFLATGTGFAPVKAMVEQLLGQQSDRAIHIIWGNRFASDFYSELPLIWSQTHAHVAYTPVVSRPDEHWTGATGYVQTIAAEQHVSLVDFDVYACGSLAMIESAQPALAAIGLLDSHFYADAFVASVPAITPSKAAAL